MSFNISSSIMKHIGRLDATIDFNTMSGRSVAMLKTYVRTGVIRTSGVNAQIAKYIRTNHDMQYVAMRGNSMFFRNIFDQSVYDAVAAAVSLCKIEGQTSDYIHVRYERGARWMNGDIAQLVKVKPPEFFIYTQNISNHFHLKKLSDSMEVNTDEPLTVDLKKFLQD